MSLIVEYQALCVTNDKPERYVSIEMEEDYSYPMNDTDNIIEIIDAVNKDLEFNGASYRVVDVFGIVKKDGEVDLWEDIDK